MAATAPCVGALHDESDALAGWRSDASQVERRCAALAHAAGPLRRALAALAGRFKALRGWERLGYARASDYTRERLGLSARELDDLARVDTALRDLPRLETALVSGALPWTKVRLVARAAKPDEEGTWIRFAQRVPVRLLEQHIRTVDVVAAGDLDDAGRREGIALQLSSETHARWQFGWRLARRMAGEALDVGGCAEVIAAEVLSALPVDRDSELASPLGTPGQRRGCWEQRPGAACSEESLEALFAKAADETDVDTASDPVDLPPSLQSRVDGLEDADPSGLDARMRCVVVRAQRLEAELGPLLLQVAQRRLYKMQGFAGLEAYAANRLGLSPRKAWALLRIERAAVACPALRQAYREGRLSWVQTHTLLPVVRLAPGRAPDWISFAARVTVRRLRDDVDRAVLLAQREPDTFADTAGVPEIDRESGLQTGANRTYAEATGHARIFFTAEKEVARLFRAALRTFQRLLDANESEALDAMLEHCFEAWGIRDPKQERDRKRRYPTFERDGWRCAVPGCTSYKNLHAHHVEPRSQGGGDEADNLVTLCAWHHLRGVHGDGVVRIQATPGPQRWLFELGVRNDGPPLAAYTEDEVHRPTCT